MNCSRWQRLVALSVSGDLEAREAQRLDAHLDDCASCRELLDQLMGDRVSLRTADAEAGGMAELGSIRGEVMARIDERPATWLPGRPALMAAVAAVVVVGALAVLMPWGGDPGEVRLVENELPDAAPVAEADPSASERPEPEPEVAPGPTVQEPAEAEPVVPVPPAEARETVQSTAPLRMAAAEPMTMKILTDDPEVVIYWIVEVKGDGNA